MCKIVKIILPNLLDLIKNEIVSTFSSFLFCMSAFYHVGFAWLSAWSQIICGCFSFLYFIYCQSFIVSTPWSNYENGKQRKEDDRHQGHASHADKLSQAAAWQCKYSDSNQSHNANISFVHFRRLVYSNRPSSIWTMPKISLQFVPKLAGILIQLRMGHR